MVGSIHGGGNLRLRLLTSWWVRAENKENIQWSFSFRLPYSVWNPISWDDATYLQVGSFASQLNPEVCLPGDSQASQVDNED